MACKQRHEAPLRRSTYHFEKTAPSVKGTTPAGRIGLLYQPLPVPVEGAGLALLRPFLYDLRTLLPPVDYLKPVKAGGFFVRKCLTERTQLVNWCLA
jgi:hypothetical protein